MDSTNSCPISIQYRSMKYQSSISKTRSELKLCILIGIYRRRLSRFGSPGGWLDFLFLGRLNPIFVHQETCFFCFPIFPDLDLDYGPVTISFTVSSFTIGIGTNNSIQSTNHKNLTKKNRRVINDLSTIFEKKQRRGLNNTQAVY